MTDPATPDRAPDDASALAATRDAWHVLAEHVLAPARHAATGRIGLLRTPGGLGTPAFASEHGERRVRIDGTDLVVADDRGERRAPVTTVRAAAELVGIEPGAPSQVYTPVTTFDPDAPLTVDAPSATRLAAWLALVDDALERLRLHVGAGGDAIVQLWPEHFDLAVSLDEVNYGGSLGDDPHPEPYLYVGPWSPPPQDGGFWNEPFGSSLDVAEVPDADAALAYFLRGREIVGG